MKVNAIVLGVLVSSAFAISQTHADQMGDLCTIVNNARNRLEALNRQIVNERNPLKQNSLQQQVGQIDRQTSASLDNFLKVNHRQFTNFTGVVSGFETTNYNNGPGVILGITLPCRLNINFQFIEVTNPAWGDLRPESQTPLSKWRTALENIVVGESVTFSGRFADGFTDGRSSAVMTELKKKGGVAHKVPDAYLPTAGPATLSQGGLSWIPVLVANNWRKANAYCAELNINGQTGWRMPTQFELQSLLNSGAAKGQVWRPQIWTSTPWPQNGQGWYSIVDITNGRVYSAYETQIYYGVSCVRASASAQ